MYRFSPRDVASRVTYWELTQNFQEGIGAAKRVTIYSDDRTVHREPVDNPAYMDAIITFREVMSRCCSHLLGIFVPARGEEIDNLYL
jgi:hypothetical protein